MRIMNPPFFLVKCLLPVAFILAVSNGLIAQTTDSLTSESDTTLAPATNGVNVLRRVTQPGNLINEVPMKYVSQQPYISLQQMMKGNLAGVYVQESTGEPGAEQNLFIRGISSPLLTKRELADQQPTVFVNGIPLIRDNPFAYEIQKYDFNRIGPATNLLGAFNVDNIESIEVIKDPVALASLGSMAANGAIWITTKNARSGFREISVNSYFGYAAKPNIYAVNAAFEDNFRQPFYNNFGTVADRLSYPPFLRDSTNVDYYGPSNWSDLYYKASPMYNVDASISGGSDRANFRFFGGYTKDANPADATSFTRYNGNFYINVAPVKWAMISSMLSYARQERQRNRNVRDRLAEQRYIPDLTNPLTPNKSLYGQYLGEFDKDYATGAIDDNFNNLIQGYLAISATPFKNFSYTGRIGFDYNEGIRDVFWPRTLLEGNNFVSNYFGYNQRLVITNSLSYNWDLGAKGNLALRGGQNFVNDIYKYDYAYANNTPNDFIKINVVNGNAGAADYLEPRGFLVNYFPSKMQSKLVSFFGNAVYTYNDALSLRAVVSREGSSNMQIDNRWFTNFSGGVGYDFNKIIDGSKFSSLIVDASFARIGKLLSDDRFNAGPSYRVDLGFSDEPTLGSYAGLGGLSRPYTAGWVGYNVPWAYSDQLNLAVKFGLLDNRLRFALEGYRRKDNDMLVPVPVPSEWGYTGAYQNGMAVTNMGGDLSIAAQILAAGSNKLGWLFTGNVNYNKNKLVALPGGLSEVVVGDNKLVVGQPVDAFWILQNNGTYNNASEVPVNPATNRPMTYKGVALTAGDPKWADLNGDYVINDEDKVLAGNYMPKVSGGFGSSLSYKNFAIDFQFYFALGRKALNQYASSRLDFVNTEANNDINSVKEIFFWDRKEDLSSYPMYNPWSPVVPYRLEQDLFLTDASFLKLRTVSLSYDFSHAGTHTAFKNCLVYVTGSNLFTVSSFKGDDPELVNYRGVYDGYGLPIPKSLILGVKLSF